jgi:hypothetical protein
LGLVVIKWNQLYGILPNKNRNIDGSSELSILSILAAWYETTALDETYRLWQHLELT